MHSSKRITSNSFFYTGALVIQKVLSSLYFWYYSNNLAAGAQDLGRFNFALSFVTLIFILGDLGLYLVFLREASKKPILANQYFNTLLTIKLPLILLAALVTLGLSKIFFIENFHLIILALLWIIIDSFAHLFYAALRSRQILKQESLAVIITEIIVITVGTISIKLTNGDPKYLILALLIGSSFNCFYALFLVISKLNFKIKPCFKKKYAYLFLKAMPAFAVSGIISKAINSIDTVMLRQLAHNFQIVGFYALPLKLITALSLTLPTALMGVLYPAFSHLFKYNTQRLSRVFKKSLDYLLIISLPICFGFMILGDEAISTLWSQEYQFAILPAKIMLWSLPAIFLAFPTGNLLNASNRQSRTALSRFFGLITMILLNLLLIPKYGLIGAAWTLVFTHYVILIFDIYFLRKIFLMIWKPLFKKFLLVFSVSLIMIIIIQLLNNLMVWYLLILIGAGVYFIILLICKGLDLQFIKHLK